MALAGFEPARCPTVSGPLCPLSYSAIYRPQRRYAPGWVRLSGGLFVVLTKALRPRLHRRCFVLPGRLLLFTACFAAWKARPSGPDRGLHRAAAYVPANTNAHVGTQASTHWRGISLSAPHVGFDCETLEQRNVKGVPRQEHTREATSYLFYISPDTPAGGMGWPLGRGWS